MRIESEQLIDDAISIAGATEGAIPYETVFHATPYERTRMVAWLERRAAAMDKNNRNN